MLGSKEGERMPLVSSCERNTENRIESLVLTRKKKMTLKSFIALIEKVPHGMGINNIYSQKHNM